MLRHDAPQGTVSCDVPTDAEAKAGGLAPPEEELRALAARARALVARVDAVVQWGSMGGELTVAAGAVGAVRVAIGLALDRIEATTPVPGRCLPNCATEPGMDCVCVPSSPQPALAPFV